MNPNTVRTIPQADGSYAVVVLSTGETLATFDSLFLARRMVCRINRSLGK